MVEGLLSARVRATGPVAWEGEFAAVRYVDARSRGVVVLRAVDAKVADHWVIVDE